MKKVKLFISFLLFLLFASSQSQVKAEGSSKAQDIPVYKKVTHLGTRTTEANVSVSLDGDNLAVSISKYVGNVNVAIIDATGCVVASRTFAVDGNGSDNLGLSSLEKGFYSLTIELDDVVYCGTFDI